MAESFPPTFIGLEVFLNNSGRIKSNPQRLDDKEIEIVASGAKYITIKGMKYRKIDDKDEARVDEHGLTYRRLHYETFYNK